MGVRTSGAVRRNVFVGNWTSGKSRFISIWNFELFPKKYCLSIERIWWDYIRMLQYTPPPRTGGFIPKIWPQRRSLFFGAVDFHHCCAFTVDFEIYAFPLCVGPVGMRLDFVWCVLCVCPVLETLRFSGKIHIWRLYLYCIGDFEIFEKNLCMDFHCVYLYWGLWFYNIKSLQEFPSVCELYAGRLIILQKFQYWHTKPLQKPIHSAQNSTSQPG